MKAWVYKHFDAEGNLLYIGMSCNPLARTVQHSSNAAWYEHIRRIEMEPFPSEEDAIEEENRLISELRPPFNRSVIKDKKFVVFGLEEKLRDEYEMFRPRVEAEIERIGLNAFCRESGVGKSVMERLIAKEPGYHMKSISMKYLRRYFERIAA